MFVTNLPARIVGAKTLEIPTSAHITVGSEGLGTRMKVQGDGLVITDVNNSNKADGYLVTSGEIIEFSGTVDVLNSGTSESVFVALITTDSI